MNRSKPNAEEALTLLKAGNERFVAGRSDHPRADAGRRRLAASENQRDYAYATILSCSDSRVPVELIFDAGIMDLFVVRVAGNVCNVDEIGCIEYGLAHVQTPLLVILGHNQCGAVTAVTQALHGRGHPLERNIPPLVRSLETAVQRAMADHPGVSGDAIIPFAIEANVWLGIENLFRESPAVRSLAQSGKTKVVGALYDIASGRVEWLSELTVAAILNRAASDPGREDS